jgi:hypothetical protein
MWYSFTSLVQKQAPVTQKMVLGVQIREPRDQSPVTRTRVRRPEIGRFGGMKIKGGDRLRDSVLLAGPGWSGRLTRG